MATLTTDQLSDFQLDLAISDDEAVFSDAELNRFYTRADGVYEQAVVIALEVLLMNSAKFTKYMIGRTSENKDQIFDHLKQMLEIKKGNVDEGAGFRIIGTYNTPDSDKTEPST